MLASFAHCEALVRAMDKDRFIAALFAPERYRRALFALYAFNVELGAVRERARERLPGQIRLQWWRDVVGGALGGEAKAHPVASALLATAVRYRLAPQALLGMIDAREFDLDEQPMQSLDELDRYASQTSSALMDLAASILNDGNDAALGDLTTHAGIAYAIAGLLSATPWHAARRQLYVPRELLQKHDALPTDIFAGLVTPPLQAAFADLRAHARAHLKAARARLADLPPALAPALLPTALVRPMLDRMERRAGRALQPDPLPQWRRQWILWRAARNPASMVG